MEIIEKDLPQLIVALDSLNDDANYIHILDAKENTNYYCPCCKGIVKPRAYKKDKNYQVQAHYYHENGDGCNEETFLHYICKTWLFEKGCKFIVDNTQYEVKDIEVEKTLHTSFGDYRPDIIVTTVTKKVFYFEIKTTNRKTELYSPKWDELGNDVVEVDTRYFINQKFNNNIPVFNLIYSDGKCFIKSYSKNDYEGTIAKRKLEWKRQDKLNYKIQWERLDWFWNSLSEYKHEKSNENRVIEYFKVLEFDDMDFIIAIVKKMNCMDLFQKLVPIINDKFFEVISKYDISPYKKVEMIQESPRIFYIAFQIHNIGNCYWYNSCFINKKVEYYGKFMFEKFKNFLFSNDFKKYSLKICPCIKDVIRYVGQHILSEENVSFYLNERCAIHWNYGWSRFSYIASNNDININQYIKGCTTLENILTTSCPKQTLTKRQHKNHMCKYDKEYKQNLFVNYFIKKINTCKNKYWYCFIYDKKLYINFKLGSIHKRTFVSLTNNQNKQDLFREIKKQMNLIIAHAREALYETERIMEII